VYRFVFECSAGLFLGFKTPMLAVACVWDRLRLANTGEYMMGDSELGDGRVGESSSGLLGVFFPLYLRAPPKGDVVGGGDIDEMPALPCSRSKFIMGVCLANEFAANGDEETNLREFVSPEDGGAV